MSRQLPPDLNAVLSLLLGQRKDYAAIAGLLAIEERAVHDRAHAALAMLAPPQARGLTPDQREQIGEYMLGQADHPQQTATRAYLASSAPARAWANALAVQLAPLATQSLPEVPDSPSPAAPTSRRGGAIVLGGLAIVVIAAVALIVGLSSGGGSGPSAPPASTVASTTTPTTTTPTTTTPTTTTTGGSSKNGSGSSGSGNSGSTSTGSSTSSSGKTHVDATLPLTPPSSDTSSKALGLVEVASRGGARAFLIAAEHLPPTTNFRYAAWLYNASTHQAFLLGRGPTVGSDGKLTAAGGLPENAADYTEILLTQEQSEKPTTPGTIVLGGAFKL